MGLQETLQDCRVWQRLDLAGVYNALHAQAVLSVTSARMLLS